METENITEKILMLKQMIEQSNNICCLSGAGFSTESGIPDFRSENGIFDAIRKFGYPPEVLLSKSFFESNTETFFEYYCNNFLFSNINPNRAHKALAELEKQNKLNCIATQNIDGLHIKAGNTKVYELHGSVYRNHCTRCGKFYSIDYLKNSNGIPRCECGGIIKPDVVLYEEPLPEKVFQEAIQKIVESDMMIVGGTSLNVYPAAGLVSVYTGNKLVIINRDTTPMDNKADLVIKGNLGDVLGDAVGIR